VIIVNEAFAERIWPGESAVGKRLKVGGLDAAGPWLTVVGVFRNIRFYGLDSEPSPLFIRPYTQAAWPSMTVVTKTASAPMAMASSIKAAIAEVEPNQPVALTRTMESVVDASVGGRRFPMQLLIGFAVLALVLAAVGIAGVVGYTVAQRTDEIGIRMALGAQAEDVLRLVMGQSLSWSVMGVAAGVVASIGFLRLLRSALFNVSPADPSVLAAVSLLLVIVALVASYVPARRALRVDPVTALRHD
jgi:putative ABC transport system permease protein